MISATNKTVAIKYIVVLYKLEVGSTVPLGAISINLFIVTVFAPTNCSSWSTPAPNLVLNVAGSIFTIKSFIALLTEISLSDVIASGPKTPALAHAVSKRPCIPPTNFVPKISARYAGIVAKPPPYIVNISIVAA